MNQKAKTNLFLASWFIVALIQNSFTDLTSDEGYYWFLSHRLQWGYYDHPPMTMLMIRVGYSIFQNELGVRLLNAILSTASFFLLFRLLPKKARSNNFAYFILLSQPLLHYFSIIVFPDTPLLFFGVLYLTGYRRLLEKNDLTGVMLFGISLAGMSYSKYYGVLFLVFTVFSNFRLLKSKMFWLALSIPLVLSIPHLAWQYCNRFVTLKYHLQQRASGFSLSYIGEFISQQILAIGPAFILVMLLYKIRGLFEKALWYIAIGTFFFFFINSFRGFVHFHWTSVAIIPVMLLAVNFYSNRRKLFYWLSIPFLVCIILFRIHIIFPFLPFKNRDIGYYKNRDQWAKEIKHLAAVKPVLFAQNFREAGLYTFYTGEMSVALFGRSDRLTQYDLWNYEDSLQGKDILFINKRYYENCKEFNSVLDKTIFYDYLPKFESYYNISLKIVVSTPVSDTLRFMLSIINNRKDPLAFPVTTRGRRPELIYQISTRNNLKVQEGKLRELTMDDKILANEASKYYFSIPVRELKSNRYKLEVGFNYGDLPPTMNSRDNEFAIE